MLNSMITKLVLADAATADVGEVVTNAASADGLTGMLNTAWAMLPGIALTALKLIAIWIIGKWLIGFAKKLINTALQKSNLDSTVAGYLTSVMGVILNLILIMAMLSIVGVNTTSFAALLAGAGLAIGTAWGGLLAHFAAGVFIAVLRPFKVGDFIEGGGVIGTVTELGLFVSKINTPDNVNVIVGNNKLFSDNIKNFTTNPYRRVELKAQLNHGVDHNQAISALKSALAKIPNVQTSPAPDVDILDFSLAGPILSVRPYVHNDHYWQVYFDTNKVIRESLGGVAGIGVPTQHYNIVK